MCPEDCGAGATTLGTTGQPAKNKVVKVHYLNSNGCQQLMKTYLVSWKPAVDGRPLAWVSVIYTFM